MNQATATTGLSQNQYLLIAGFAIVVVVGAYAYYSGFFAGETEAPPPQATTSP